VNVREFARRAEISLSTAYALIAERTVAHRRIGQRGKRGTIRVTEEDFKAWSEQTKEDLRDD